MARVSRHLTELLRHLAYAERWLFISLLIGVVAGLFAFAFYKLLMLASGLASWMLGVTPKPLALVHDIALAVLEGSVRWPLIVAVVVAGAGVSSVLVYRLAPEAEGHGTDAAINAFHKRAALIGFNIPLVKAVASALTIGFGGSGGVEGPSAQMGAGLGSVLARILRLPFQARRIALVSGVAAALSALFRAPLGTALFAVEVLYKRDLERCSYA